MDILLIKTFQKTPPGSQAIKQHEIIHVLPKHPLERRFSKVEHAGLMNQTSAEMSL